MQIQDQKKILVVDDDNFVLRLVEMALQTNPSYQVFTASNVKEALHLKESNTYDLIITDIIMPEIDGIKFIDQLRKTDHDTPIIAISGGDKSGNVDSYIEFANYFATETLKKPFTKQELLSLVSMTISQQNDAVFQLFN